MFDLEQSIADWRRQMLAAGIKTPVPLEELESHLHEEFDRQSKLHSNTAAAFEAAATTVGAARPLVKEFRKVGNENVNLPLAWLAWGIFAISLFLPVVLDQSGWQCAWWCILFPWYQTWHELWQESWQNTLLVALNYSNLWMLASPLLFYWFNQNARRRFWLRLGNFLALTLVWSYIGIPSDRSFMQIGGYTWALSFLLLNLSLPVHHNLRKKHV